MAIVAVIVLAVVAGVVAFALSRSRAGTETAPLPSAPVERSPEPTIAAPAELAAEVNPFKVVLSWAAVPDATGYGIERDGVPIGSSTAARYVDDTALPDQRYDYAVVAEGPESASVPALLEVATPRASPGLARLDGLFNVRMKERSHHGLTLGKGGKRFTAAWRFVPGCERGACAVRWTDRSTRGLAAELKRGGARYRGSVFGRFGGSCGGTITTATVTVDLRVVGARAEGDEWIADELVGTFTSRSASQLGCVSAGVVYGFTAKLV